MTALPHTGRRWTDSPLLPVLGSLLAAGILLSRRPDALLHAQLWAEDGHIFYADVYNLGIKHSLILPQAGYFVTFAMLAAWIARFFPVADAPFVMALLSLCVQVLPVGLLLSRRAETVTADIRIRVLLAAIYLLIPNQLELDATAVNAQWFLAVAALTTVFLSPPAKARWRWLDGAILVLAGLSGPFVIFLALIAWWRRRTRGTQYVPDWELALLAACAVVQIVSLLFVAPHDAHSAGVEPRPHPGLGATPNLLATLVGGRLFLGTIIGEAHGLQASLAIQWIALVGGIAVTGVAFRRGRQELVLFALFAAGILFGALLRPSTPTPAWPILASVPPNSQRYWMLAEIAWLAVLVSLATTAGPRLTRLVSAGVVTASLIVLIAGHWSFPSAPPSPYARQAAVFTHAPRGKRVTFLIDPPPWSMTLVKR
jgi:hypothetical protein